MQQSATEDQLLPLDEKSLRQLSLPHVILPKQSESLSQSPPPTSQGELLEQQLQSVIGTPLHCPAGGVPVDDAVMSEQNGHNKVIEKRAIELIDYPTCHFKNLHTYAAVCTTRPTTSR